MRFVSRSAPYVLGFTLIVAFAQPMTAAGRNAGQKPPTVESGAPKADSATPQERGLSLLNQLLTRTNDFQGSWKSLKAALLQTEAADLLWSYDQPRARSLFETAIKSAEAQIPKIAGGKPLSTFHTEQYSALCRELIGVALARDAALAERLVMLALAPLPADDPKGEGFDAAYRSERARLYSQIAERIAATDPRHAAELIRLTFNGWYSGGQIRALNALRRHAPQLADEIFLNVLATVRNKPTGISNKAGILAPYVFPDIKNEVGIMLQRSGDADLQAQISSALIKSFLESVYDSFTPQPTVTQTAENNAFGFASFDRYTMQELIPRFERHLPDKAATFRARVEEVVAHIKQSGRQDMFEREDEAWGEAFRQNVQELIKKAETAKTQKERDYNYSEAAGVLAYRDGDFEQALALMDKVSDSASSKPYLLQAYRRMRTGKAIKAGDAEKAYRYSQDLQDAESRAHGLIAAGRLFAKNGNAERAKAVLAEASQLMATKPPNEYLILDRATVAVEISPAYGFQIMKEAVEAINASRSGGEHGGIGFGGDTGITYLYRHNFDGNLGVLARADFDRALELAKRIKPKEVSLLAQFAACKGALGKAGKQSGSVPGNGIKE